MKKIIRLLFFCILTLSFNFIEAQIINNTKSGLRKSNSEIIKFYKSKLNSGLKLENVEIREYGIALFENNQYKASLQYLEQIKDAYLQDDAMLFMLSHAYKANDNYEEGNKTLDLYFNRRNKEKLYEVNYKDLELIDLLGDRYTVKSLDKINTESSDLFNYEDVNFIYYSSNDERNNLKEKKSVWNDKYFYNEYKFNKNDSTVSSIKNINTNYHDSNIIFTQDKKQGFITSNEMDKNSFYKKNETIQLSIYLLKYDTKGKLVEKKYLPFNSTEYSCKNPYYNEKNKLLYFSSNMISGRGGYDIYSYNIETNKLRNIVEINSINDENDIFIDESNDIYFSSNGYYGWGGLDIYFAKYNKVSKKYDRIMNVGRPVNTNSDDFGIFIKDKKGYYTSKIKGSDDIYSFIETKELSLDAPFRILKGNVKLVDDTKIEFINSLKIYLIDNKNNSIPLDFNKQDLSFEQKMYSNAYTLKMVDNDDYELVTDKINLEGSYYSTTNSDIIIKLLPPTNTYYGTVYNGTRNTPLLNLKVIISDLDKNVVASVLTNEKGEYSIKVPANQKYILETKYECTDPFLPNYIEYLESTLDKKINKNIVLKEVTVCGLQVNENGKLLVETNPILFDVNKFVITNLAKLELNKVIEIMKYDQNFKLKVNSHTDNQGSEKHNLLLSENRAKATVNYILSQGINTNRVSYLFHGESKPLFDCKDQCTVLEMSKNRRSEFELE